MVVDFFRQKDFFPSVYLVEIPIKKAPEQIVNTKNTADLVFGGDVMLSRKIGLIIKEKKDVNYFWEPIKEIFSKADISFVNLESPISDKGKNVGSIYSFHADPLVTAGLTYSGIDIVSFANNHVWDWGKESFLDTMKNLHTAGVEYAGSGENFSDSHTPKIFERNGIKVAYLAYTNLVSYSLRGADSSPSVAGIDLEQIEKDIKKARENGADFVATSFHFGEEYETEHNAYQEQIAHSVIDVGANIVIGHHPHVAEEVELYKGGVIAYSLGNLIFDQNFSRDTSWGLVLKIRVDQSKVLSVEKIPVHFDSTYRPIPGTIETVL